MTLNGMPPIGWDDGRWSTVEEIQQFVQWVGDTPWFDRHLIDTTLRGNELNALTAGTGPEHRTIMLILGIHGTERPAREVALIQLRDWVQRLDAGDANLEGWLDRNRLVVLPCTNPDGAELGYYGNSRRIDPAQDGFKLETAERRAIERAFKIYNPAVVTDHHQTTSQNFHLLMDSNRGADTPALLYGEALQLREAIRAAVQAEGHPVGIYTSKRARAIMHTATYRHAVAFLAEGIASAPESSDQAAIDIHRTVMQSAMDWADQNFTEVNAARADSLNRALTGDGPEVHAFNELVVTGQKTRIYVDGYHLNQPLPAIYADLYELETQDGGTFIPIKQKARGFIPELMDPAVHGRSITARRRINTALLPGAPTAYVQIDGDKRTVNQMILMQDGQRRTVQIGAL